LNRPARILASIAIPDVPFHMEKKKEPNKALAEEIHNTITDLLKEIGNNRQQLMNKVLAIYKGIHKELTKDKVDAEREKGIRKEVAAIVRMARHQLPQHITPPAPKPAKKKAK